MSSRYPVPLDEVELSAIRAQGAGGQNVNKVSSAVHLRFDINASSLPEAIRERLLKLGDQRISKEGVVVIKAQEFRSLEGNRAEALRRLREMIAFHCQIASADILFVSSRVVDPDRCCHSHELRG